MNMVQSFELFQPLNQTSVVKFSHHNALLERAQDLSSDVTSELFLTAMALLRTFEYMVGIPPGFVNIPKELDAQISHDAIYIRKRR